MCNIMLQLLPTKKVNNIKAEYILTDKKLNFKTQGTLIPNL